AQQDGAVGAQLVGEDEVHGLAALGGDAVGVHVGVHFKAADVVGWDGAAEGDLERLWRAVPGGGRGAPLQRPDEQRVGGVVYLHAEPQVDRAVSLLIDAPAPGRRAAHQDRALLW